MVSVFVIKIEKGSSRLSNSNSFSDSTSQERQVCPLWPCATQALEVLEDQAHGGLSEGVLQQEDGRLQ